MARKQAAKRCRNCGKPSAALGAVSGTCPDCQNESVASLEEDYGMERGALGRVDRCGNVVERKAVRR